MYSVKVYYYVRELEEEEALGICRVMHARAMLEKEDTLSHILPILTEGREGNAVF